MDLEDRAAIFLEEMYVSGDAMIDMDHCLDELTEEEQGAFYLHQLLALFVTKEQKRDDIAVKVLSTLLSSIDANGVNNRFKEYKKAVYDAYVIADEIISVKDSKMSS